MCNNYRNFCELFHENWLFNVMFIPISLHSPKYSLVSKEQNVKKSG